MASWLENNNNSRSGSGGSNSNSSGARGRSPAMVVVGGGGGGGGVGVGGIPNNPFTGAAKKDAREWSVSQIRALLQGQKYDTSAGLFEIQQLEKCEGNAFTNKNQGITGVVFYEWRIRLKWGLTPNLPSLQPFTGTIEINNFTSTVQILDADIKIRTEEKGDDIERLVTGCRAAVVPRIRDALENYVYYLLDKLNSSKQNSFVGAGPPSKPSSAKAHVWLKTGQQDGADTENEPPNQSATNANFDIFTEREGAGGMRVGRDFQAKIPPMLPAEERRNVQDIAEKALLVWSPPPNDKLTEDEVERYLLISRDEYQYSGEQALGLLYWHKYDIDRSIEDLRNFTPHPEEWTVEDKVLFEQARQFHGKAFDKIRQMLPDKSMSSLIRYYYKWKKYKSRPSVMDRQVKQFNKQDQDDDSSSYASFNNNNDRHTPLPGAPVGIFRAMLAHQPGTNGNQLDGDEEVIELDGDEY